MLGSWSVDHTLSSKVWKDEMRGQVQSTENTAHHIIRIQKALTPAVDVIQIEPIGQYNMPL